MARFAIIDPLPTSCSIAFSESEPSQQREAPAMRPLAKPCPTRPEDLRTEKRSR